MSIFNWKRNKGNKELTKKNDSNEASTDVEIVIDEISDISNIDEKKLVKINDSSINKGILTLISNCARAAAPIKNGVQLLKQPPLYRVELKNGGELVRSRSAEGAFRAFVRNKDSKIVENANLFKFDTKDLAVKDVVSGGFNVLTLAVGQYYMCEVNSKLSEIAGALDAVSKQFEIQYKSKVASLIESVSVVSEYQITTITDEELRNRELDNLQDLRKECQALLNHAELAIENIISKKYEKFDEYAEKVKELDKWISYRNALIAVLNQIDILDCAMSLGKKSQDQCFKTLKMHEQKAISARDSICVWHKAQCDLLRIDVEEEQRKHVGVLSLIEKPISLINEKWTYKPVEKEIVTLIKEQTSDEANLITMQKDLFASDVVIVVKDGELYYLLDEDDEL